MENVNKNNITQKSKIRIYRIIFIVLGCISLVLGCIGIILPVLPTVPFFLFTTYCFGKGSEKFHNCFINTKLYKKHMSGFAEHKTMSIGGELTLMFIVTIMLIGACLMAQEILAMAIIIPILIASKYIYFIINVKTVSKEELEKIKQKTKCIVGKND